MRMRLVYTASVLICATCLTLGSVTTASCGEKMSLVDAAEAGDLASVKSFIALKANVNTKGQDGITPLMVAANGGHIDVVRTLLESKADVNAKNEIGATALMFASYSGHVEIVRVLLAANADVNAFAEKDNKRQTALSIASENSHAEVVTLLKQAGAVDDTGNVDAGTRGPFFQLQWQGRGVTTEIMVNGVPFEKSDFPSGGIGAAPINLWLKPGVNNIVVTLTSLNDSAADDRAFNLLLEMAKPGQFSGDGEKIFDFVWTGDKAINNMPIVKRFEFTPRSVPSIQLWSKAEKVNLDVKAEREIRDYLKIISDAYVKANVGKVAELIEFKTVEYGAALTAVTPSLAEIKKMVKLNFDANKSEKMKFKPIDVRGAKLLLVGDSRIVMVTSKNGEAPLVATSPGNAESQQLKLYLARMNGKWVWVR